MKRQSCSQYVIERANISRGLFIIIPLIPSGCHAPAFNLSVLCLHSLCRCGDNDGPFRIPPAVLAAPFGHLSIPRGTGAPQLHPN